MVSADAAVITGTAHYRKPSATSYGHAAWATAAAYRPVIVTVTVDK